MTNTLTTVQVCSYRRQDDGVHMFAFQDSTRSAVDQWVDYLDDILGAARLDVPLAIALDIRESEALPLAYMTQRLRGLFANYDARPPLRIALISNQGALILLIHLLAQIAAADDTNPVAYHHAHDEDEALAWLLAPS